MPELATRGDALRIHQFGVELENYLVPSGTASGVAISKANESICPGIGSLKTSRDGAVVAFKAPGDSEYGRAEEIETEGDLLLESSDAAKWLRVHVYPDYVSEGIQERSIVLSPRHLYVEFSATQAENGYTLQSSLTLINASPFELYNVVAWLDPCSEYVWIRKSGGTYSQPRSEQAADAVSYDSIAVGSNATLYYKFELPKLTDSNPSTCVMLHVSWDRF